MQTYVSQFNEHGEAPLVLVCDHASNHMPPEFGDLGLSKPDLERHIAWDIGALGLARGMAQTLDAPLVHPTASRLILDCNRDPYAASDSIPQSSEDTIIPGIPGNSAIPP
jgi:predicted N-formylglutamate amidohydrolase